MPEVSVIVTTYNRKEFLTETLNSILDQTYADFELIVVDNYSNYDFLSHISSFNDKRIRPFQNQNSGIIAVNRNFGIKQANGKYLAFCDDDDIWKKDKLKYQINIFEENQNCVLISTLTKSIGEHCKFNMVNYGIINLRQVLIKKLINYSNPIIFSSAMIKKQDILTVGGFNEEHYNVGVEDIILWNKLSQIGNFVLIKKILTYYRFQKTNVSKGNKNQISYNKKYYNHKKYLSSKTHFYKFYNYIQILISSLIHLFFIKYFNSKKTYWFLKTNAKTGIIKYRLLEINSKIQEKQE
jgi:teichuronic acid biosynthesis glycosyltransferase TuaG